jgi:hypothetical protein
MLETRPTRLIAATIVLAVLVVALIVIRPARSDEGTTYRNDALGWTATLPAGWEQLHPEAADEAASELGPTLASNTFFANGPAGVIDDQPISSPDQLVSPPGAGVVLWVMPMDARAVLLDMVDDDTSYPPAPALAPTGGSENHDGASFRADGLRFSVDAFYGAGVSPADRDEATALATSIAVPPAPAPPEGAAILRFPHQPDVQAWRVGSSDRFAPGTVVEVRIEAATNAGQPKNLFVVTPEEPINGSEHWMISGADRRCDHTALTWDGTVFRCGGRSFSSDGVPTDGHGMGLAQSSVVLTWEGQLIAALNGAVSTSQAIS